MKFNEVLNVYYGSFSLTNDNFIKILYYFKIYL